MGLTSETVQARKKYLAFSFFKQWSAISDLHTMTEEQGSVQGIN